VFEKEGKFGHLREVNVNGFLAAVEQEERGVWVVIHIYEPVRLFLYSFRFFTPLLIFIGKTVERCSTLDSTLAVLAQTYPDTKFIRARASSLGFASTASSRSIPHRTIPGQYPNSRKSYDDDDDDEYENDDDDLYEDEAAGVDTDMLPTMLVYRDGDLVHNWVRVDWEAGRAGIEELLSK